MLLLDDARTLQAIGILADVIDGVSGPGVIDTVLVSKALRQVLATRSQPAFDFAARAFSSLDPKVKQQIAHDADLKAHDSTDLRGRVTDILTSPLMGGTPSNPTAASPPIPPRNKNQLSPHATGLLSAINTRVRSARPPQK
ncbi:DUF222 domain-containing protein [Azospirillaceae bacterium]